jgi:uncharacterized RDD family membrane protein YckC
MINTYYLLQNGQQIGPYTQYELMAMDLNGQDMVLSPLADDWQEALDLPEFAEYFETKGIYLPTRANLASFWWRVLAYFIDYVIILLMVVILFSALAIFSSFTAGPITDEYIDNNEPLIKLVAVILMITYHATFEATTLRGSIGKMICKLAVVDINGERLKFGNALSRNLGKILSAMVMGLGFLNILWDKKRQGWHDGLAKTYVVRKP